MALAMAQAFVRQGDIAADAIIASDPTLPARERFEQSIPGCTTTQDNQQVADQADVVLLAVKPQMIEQVARSAKIGTSTLLISIAAGVGLSRLSEAFQTKNMVRVMPNTPCLVGMNACGYSLPDDLPQQQAQLAQQLLESTGIAYRLPESQLDAVTGLSGSGPAFVYIMIEALADAGVRMGLPRNVSLELAAQTVRGAAEMVQVTGQHPGLLKDQVTSPGGTTIAGIHALERDGFRGIVMNAVQAAAERSRELGAN